LFIEFELDLASICRAVLFSRNVRIGGRASVPFLMGIDFQINNGFDPTKFVSTLFSLVLNYSGPMQGGDSMGGALRILQAGDFQLDQPIQTGTILSQEHRETVINARYLAAQRTIATAISHSADIVLLCGNMFNWSEDRRPAWFLVEQFGRFQQAGIDVVWMTQSDGNFVTGKVADFVPWSTNVHFVSPSQPSLLTRDGRSIRIGTESALKHHLHKGSHADLTIQLQHVGDVNLLTYHSQFDDAALKAAVNIAQATSDRNPGAHGIDIVTCFDGDLRSTFVATDAVRWVTEAIAISGLNRDQLKSEISTRCERHYNESCAFLTLCNWQFTGHGALWNELRTKDETSLRHFFTNQHHGQNMVAANRVDLIPDAAQISDWSEERPMSVAFGELESHFGETDALELIQTPSWARHYKTPSIKQSVVREIASRIKGLSVS